MGPPAATRKRSSCAARRQAKRLTPSFLHHPRRHPAAHTAAAHTGAGRLGLVGHDALGGEDVLGDRRGVLQRRTGDHGRVDDAGLDQVLVLVGVGVEALARLERLDLVHHDRTLEAGVLGDLTKWLLERAGDDLLARAEVDVIGLPVDLDRVDSVDQHDAAARHDALFEGGAGGVEGVLDAVLGLLHLDLGGRADLDDGHAAGQLGETLLELLTVEIGVGVLDLRLDLLDAALDGLGVAGAVDDRGVVLRHDDLAGAAELRELGLVELEAHLLGDDLAAGEDGDVLEHALAAVAEAGGLDGDAGERAAQLVHDQGRESFTLDVLGHDEDLLAGLDDLLEHGEQVLDGADLLVGDEDVRVLEHGFHALGVGDHVRAEVALVELHALSELEVEAEGIGLLDVAHAVLAELLVEHHIAALGAEGDLYGVGERVDATLQGAPGLVGILQFFSHATSASSLLCDYGQDLAGAQDQELVTIGGLVLGARVLAVDDLVALLDVDGDTFLAVFVPLAVAYGDDLAHHRLLFGRVGQHDAAGRLLLFGDGLDDHAVFKRLELHAATLLFICPESGTLRGRVLSLAGSLSYDRFGPLSNPAGTRRQCRGYAANYVSVQVPLAIG